MGEESVIKIDLARMSQNETEEIVDTLFEVQRALSDKGHVLFIRKKSIRRQYRRKSESWNFSIPALQR